MEEMWKVFNNAYQRKVKTGTEYLPMAKKYITLLSKRISLSEKQISLMSDIILSLLSEKKEIDEISSFFGFLFPLPQLQNAMRYHKTVIEEMKKETIVPLTTEQIILTALHERMISNDLASYIWADLYCQRYYTLMLCLSYAAHMDLELFGERRVRIFEEYKKLFSTTEASIPKTIFMTEDFQLLEMFQKLQSMSKENSLLSVSLSIVYKLKCKHLNELIDKTREVYEELRHLFTLIKNHLEENAYEECTSD